MTTRTPTKPAPHPAKFSDKFGEAFRELLWDSRRILDPFGGVGKLAILLGKEFPGEVWINELEPEWAAQAPNWAHVTTCDAEHLPFLDGYFDAICTSPAYGNRMADHHNAKDASRRNTYTHQIGRKLSEGNTGGMQWGPEYQAKHLRIWQDCKRVLTKGGRLVLNSSNHIRKGQEVKVTEWHIECLTNLGFALIDHRKIPTPRNRYGANGGVRVPHESLLAFILQDTEAQAR